MPSEARLLKMLNLRTGREKSLSVFYLGHATFQVDYDLQRSDIDPFLCNL